MVPARAEMGDGIVGISWKTCARQNCWCGLRPTGIIKTLGFFYLSFNYKQIFFSIGQDLSEICAGDILLKNHWSPWRTTKGILSGHSVGNWGGQLELVEPGHFGWGFAKAAYPSLWRFGGPKDLHFLHIWKSYALSLRQSSPSVLPNSRAGIVPLRAAEHSPCTEPATACAHVVQESSLAPPNTSEFLLWL